MRVFGRSPAYVPTDRAASTSFKVRFVSLGAAFQKSDEDPEAIKNELTQAFRDLLESTKGEFREGIVADAQRIAHEAAEAMAPKQITLVAPTKKKKVVIDGDRHKQYEETLEVITALNQAFLVGPAGTGKSTLARQIAEDLELDYAYLPCSEGLSEAQILGRMSIQGEYIQSEAVRVIENGGLLMLDEVAGMDANVGLVLNELLANGVISIPNRVKKPLGKRHANCVVICADNTYGTGSDVSYVGRNQLDAAFLDRFAGGIVEVGYDLERERLIAETYEIVPLLEAIWKIRANVEKNRLARPVTTRWIINLGKLHQGDKDKYDYATLLERTLRGWTEQEKAKALEGVNVESLKRGVAAVTSIDPLAQATPVPKDDAPGCPRCGRAMVKRTAGKGPRKGQPFYGCSTYPRCDGTRDIPAANVSGS
jgi:MoxR-like ATPase